MSFEINEWPANERVGKAYGFLRNGRFHGILETRAGAYRGNHVHPVDQYTLLLEGRGKYLLYEDGRRMEVDLVQGEVFVARAGVPHILVPVVDCFTFEWWDGDFVDQEISGIFDDIVKERVGPKD
ncbi:MAG: cupin domain-containing protein [Candidatus Bathyarchaeota archaeon]|nr:MAG: cupin domain-containing protein [Candidatus Bathyarchaeota archaeon]